MYKYYYKIDEEYVFLCLCKHTINMYFLEKASYKVIAFDQFINIDYWFTMHGKPNNYVDACWYHYVTILRLWYSKN